MSGDAKHEIHAITTDPGQIGGIPRIRGLHILIATIIGMVADGMNEREILDADRDLVMSNPNQGHIKGLMTYTRPWLANGRPMPTAATEARIKR